jgi:hypothetical protein
VYAFTRPGDAAAQAFARTLGAVWAGSSDLPTPEPLDAAIIFAPVGALVPKALRDLVKGGIVICAGIHMTDIPQFPYAILWGSGASIGREPDPARRRRIHCLGRTDPDSDQRRHLPLVGATKPSGRCAMAR